MATGFCPSCGATRGPGAYCANCGAAFEAGHGSIQPNLASGLLEIERMRLKLIPFRIAGLVIGLALWWFVAGPAFGGDFVPTIVSLFALAGGGLYVGQAARALVIFEAVTPVAAGLAVTT